jgi:hypothetical protein
MIPEQKATSTCWFVGADTWFQGLESAGRLAW